MFKLSDSTAALVAGALAAKGMRYANKVTDPTLRDAAVEAIATQRATTAAAAKALEAKRRTESAFITYPDGYLEAIDKAFRLAKLDKHIRAVFRRVARREGYSFDSARLRSLAVRHAAVTRAMAPLWATPVAPSDLTLSPAYENANRYMNKIRANYAGIWSSTSWMGIDPRDVFQTAVELAIRQDGAPTVGGMYRAIKRAYKLETRLAFVTRSGGAVSVDDIGEVEFNSAYFRQIDQLETFGRIAVTPEQRMQETYSDLLGTVDDKGRPYASRTDAYAAVVTAQHDAREVELTIASKVALRRMRAAVSETADANAQMSAAIVALLLDGATIDQTAELFGLTAETITRYALAANDAPHNGGIADYAYPAVDCAYDAHVREFRFQSINA